MDVQFHFNNENVIVTGASSKDEKAVKAALEQVFQQFKNLYNIDAGGRPREITDSAFAKVIKHISSGQHVLFEQKLQLTIARIEEFRHKLHNITEIDGILMEKSTSFCRSVIQKLGNLKSAGTLGGVLLAAVGALPFWKSSGQNTAA